MKLFAYVNLGLAVALIFFFGFGVSLAAVTNFFSPVVHAQLLDGIAHLPVTQAIRSLLFDMIGWPAWAYPAVFSMYAGLIVMGRFKRRV